MKNPTIEKEYKQQMLKKARTFFKVIPWEDYFADRQKNWDMAKRKYEFTYIKGIKEGFLNKAGIDDELFNELILVSSSNTKKAAVEAYGEKLSIKTLAAIAKHTHSASLKEAILEKLSTTESMQKVFQNTAFLSLANADKKKIATQKLQKKALLEIINN